MTTSVCKNSSELLRKWGDFQGQYSSQSRLHIAHTFYRKPVHMFRVSGIWTAVWYCVCILFVVLVYRVYYMYSVPRCFQILWSHMVLLLLSLLSDPFQCLPLPTCTPHVHVHPCTCMYNPFPCSVHPTEAHTSLCTCTCTYMYLGKLTTKLSAIFKTTYKLTLSIQKKC